MALHRNGTGTARKAYSRADEVGSIAHDLNNLLDVISRLAALQIRVPDASQNARNSHRIQATVRRASELTHQLFTLTSTPSARPTELPGVLADIADLAQVVAGDDLEIRIVSAPQTWPVLVDPSGLQRAIVNLVVNSIRAMPRGIGGVIVVTTFNIELSNLRSTELQLAGEREVVEIKVVDSGAGMSEVTLARALGSHFTTKPDPIGSGLGLAQVQAFVRDCNGALEVRSAPGVGTTASLYLPRARNAPMVA